MVIPKFKVTLGVVDLWLILVDYVQLGLILLDLC